MPVWCQLCELSFEEPLELEVHYLSLSHHIKLEANNPVVHSCSPCGITGLSLGEYSKHVDTENHRKKRERIRAIIDTMDAGEGPRVHFNFNRDRSQHVSATPSYLEPTSSFVRSGFQRSTYPVPKTGDGTRSHHTRSRRPIQQSCGEAFEGSSSYQQNFDPPQANTISARDGEEWARNFPHSFVRGPHPSHDRPSTHFETDGHSLNVAEQLGSRCGGEDSYEGTGEDNMPPQKRGLLARLSLRRRGKAAKMSSSEKSAREKDKKIKRKKSQSRSPASPSLKTKVTEAESPSRRRAVLNVAMEDKTKKWELVAVKGKASYLKNRSQRMFKDRMNKYRLVDSKGMVVEDIHEEEASTSTSRNSRSASDGKQEANVPQFSSHIWGTGPEAIPRSQRSDFHSEAHRVFKLPPVPPPRAPLISSGSSSQEESGGYATLNVLPMSTPKNYNAAMRAYENYEDRNLKVLDRMSAKAPIFGVASTNTDTVSTVSLDTSCSHSFTSSLAVESHSLTSRLNLTNANADRFADVVTVKEETVDSPPPDALPSPPQFEQTMQLQSTTEGRMAGDKFFQRVTTLNGTGHYHFKENQIQRSQIQRKSRAIKPRRERDRERDEFWALGILEHKKGHEILDMRAKVEKLQKELFEATSCLQKLEVEMNEILRRKSELLGLAASDSAT